MHNSSMWWRRHIRVAVRWKGPEKKKKILVSARWSPWCCSLVVFNGQAGLCRCLSVCLSPVHSLTWHPTKVTTGQMDPRCGWVDQARRHYQTTHSEWHRLRGLSVLVGRGSAGTMETLQSNKAIRKEADTPVRYRVTETKGMEGGWKEERC